MLHLKKSITSLPFISDTSSWFLLTCLVISALLQPGLCTYRIQSDLSKVCPPYSTIKEFMEKIQEDNTDAKLVYINVSKAMTDMANTKAKLVGQGAFGKVFTIGSYQDVLKTKKTKDAVKMISIKEDGQGDGDGDQRRLTSEVMAQVELLQLPKGCFFIPIVNYCVDVREPFINLNSQKQIADKTNIYVKNGKTPFLLSVENLDYELEKYNQKFLAGELEYFAFIERVQLGINSLKGVILINKLYYHCDIKSENMMLKKLTSEEADNVVGQGLKLIETEIEQYYLIKYIDFGLVAKANNGAGRCVGGTPGYIAWEFKDKNTKHDKFDLFSLALTLLDNEMNTMYMTNLGNIFGYTQNLKYGKGTLNISSDDEDVLNDDEMIQLLKQTIDSQTLSGKYRARVKARIPNIAQLVKQVYTDGDWENDKPSNFLYVGTDIFEVMIIEALYFLPERSKFRFQHDKKILKVDREIESLKQKIANEKNKESESANTDKLSLEFRENYKVYLGNLKLFRIEYFRYLVNLVVPYSMRPSNEIALKGIMDLLKNFKLENATFLKVLEQLDLRTLVKEYSQRSEEEQQKALELIEKRKLRYATIYNLESSQFNHSRLLII